jgi:hypothetical protein
VQEYRTVSDLWLSDAGVYIKEIVSKTTPQGNFRLYIFHDLDKHKLLLAKHICQMGLIPH